ncbi:IS3 family transposase [Corallincola platygyrae]|uniref:IS3 family transposase n=1 Tax=Corallincola platygyrae TaxID=1193278 RepID=A0ABW4XKG9_9GAMM
MPAYKNAKKTKQYTTEFKATAVKLTHYKGATVKGVAESLGIHPFMLSRWRKEYREGKIMSDRRKKLIKKPASVSENERIAALEKENARLRLENDLLKKATIRSGRKPTRFRFIDTYRRRYPIALMCRFLNVSRAGYYAWKQRDVSHRYLVDRVLEHRIKQLFETNRGVYGSPRIHAALKREGISTSRKRVARLMRENGLRARCARVYRRFAGLHRFFLRHPNIRRELPKPTKSNEHWAADLTYVRQGQRWLYLAVVIDLYSRRVVGWSLGAEKSAALTLSSLRMAIRNRRPEAGLIFHTDRGSEYGAAEIQQELKKHGIRPSMNRPGYCTDNAEMESFFHSLKGELVKGVLFKSECDLRDKVAGYIQHFYNRIRLHSSLNYMSPIEYEAVTR